MIKKTVLLTVVLLLFQMRVFAVPDDLIRTKDEIESYVYEVSMSTANTHDDITQYLTEQTESMLVGDTVLYDIAVTEFTAASSSGDGGEGEFTFVAELRCGEYRLTTSQISGVINTSRVVVTVASGSPQVTQGEPLLLSAEAFEISGAKYEWYRSSVRNGVGERIDGANKKTYSPPTDSAYSAYFYCVCNGVRSNYVEIQVLPPFKPVQSIELKFDTVYEGDAVQLDHVIKPDDASNKEVEWTVYGNDGKARITDGVFYAEGAGAVTVVAVIKNGIAENTDFAESFTVTVLTKPRPKPTVQQINIDVSGIPDLGKVYASVPVDAADKTVGFYPISKGEARKIVDMSGLDGDGYYTLTSFSRQGTSADKYEATLSSYRGELILISQKGEEITHGVLQAEDGSFVLGDFDKAVILVKKEFEPAWLLASLLTVPIVGVLLIAANKTRKEKGRGH